MRRSEFLQALAAGVLTLSLSPLRLEALAADRKPLRFGILTDAHYADRTPSGSRHYADSIAKVREAVEATPSERILIETDCPYLAPVPYRGQMNHSGLMRYTAEAIAAVKGLRYDEVLRITSENAKKMYRI